jgi:hypothetical protein
MMQFWAKTLISALMIAGISELGKRSPVMGGLLASLPLTSLLAMIWLYLETRNPLTVAQLSTSILWLVLPSLLLFIALPALLKNPALIVSCLLTALAYTAMLALLKKVGILTQ